MEKYRAYTHNNHSGFRLLNTKTEVSFKQLWFRDVYGNLVNCSHVYYLAIERPENE